MTKDDLMRMAQEAGALVSRGISSADVTFSPATIERFANLVAAAEPCRSSYPLKEQTMRTLFHFHKWSKWTDPVQTYSGHKQQWRVCVHCNHASFRTLWWDKQTSLIAIIESLKGLTK